MEQIGKATLRWKLSKFTFLRILIKNLMLYPTVCLVFTISSFEIFKKLRENFEIFGGNFVKLSRKFWSNFKEVAGKI